MERDESVAAQRPEGVPLAGPAEFLARSQRRFCERLVPGFGWIRIQNLTELELSEWETDDIGADGKRTADGMKETRVYLIVKALVNAAGERRFHDSDVGQLMGCDSAVIGCAFEYCREWCGIAKRDVDAVAALRAIQKNYNPGPA